MKPSIEQIKAAYAAKGYAYFPETTPYNVNIWGIRKRFGKTDLFDDLLGVSCGDEQGNIVHLFHEATVDPGLFYLKNELLNPKGTFVLKPGQYRGCWEKGKHKGKYIALVQKQGYSKFQGWRDNRLDGEIQRQLDVNGNFYQDVSGMNMHRSSETLSSIIGKFSAGCQVRQVNAQHKAIMTVIDKSLQRFGNSFSYTLFDEEEVFPEAEMQTRSLTGEEAPVWPDSFIKVQYKE